jgi:hypothetical protein
MNRLQKRLEALERPQEEMMTLRDVIRLQSLIVDALVAVLKEFDLDTVAIRQRLSEKFTALACAGLPVTEVDTQPHGGSNGHTAS